ncbi:MAG TPA: flavodoxin family protein [Lentimicrobium sp.]|nr:flavodoxin family protein [Lentimicrobium sp.]
MKSLIIYESVYGNTGKIAFVLRDALLAYGDAIALKPDNLIAEDLKDYDLILAGSPTQKFSMLPSIRAFLAEIPRAGLKGKKVAAFDTRVDVAKINNRFLSLMAKLFGYAAPGIASALRKKGGELLLPAEGFLVEDTEGPLTEGEEERARAWAGSLAQKAGGKT